MSDLKYWIAFTKLNFIGSRFITSLWEHFGSIKEAWFADTADLVEIEGLKYDKIEAFISERKKINPGQALEEIEKRDINVLTISDKNYPFLLRHIYNPPAVLFIKGDLKRCNLDRALAVVGSRKASHYISEILKKLILDLRNQDITIVSGMAIGVDSIAHNSAIKNDMKTIAVLGCGFDNIYPKTNKNLFKEIADFHGAVISEYYPTDFPEVWKFPQRNRIISGLCKGTLIAEAGLKSGALITAKLCLEQNRELMCIPGLITNPNTEGTHYLIKNGAGLVTNSKDIFEHLNWEQKEIQEELTDSSNLNLLDNEKKIYEILSLEPEQFDAILGKSKMTTSELMTVLTSLELQGFIKQLPGQKFIRTLSS